MFNFEKASCIHLEGLDQNKEFRDHPKVKLHPSPLRNLLKTDMEVVTGSLLKLMSSPKTISHHFCVSRVRLRGTFLMGWSSLYSPESATVSHHTV